MGLIKESFQKLTSHFKVEGKNFKMLSSFGSEKNKLSSDLLIRQVAQSYDLYPNKAIEINLQ